MQPKRLGNWGWYFRVLKWASENGLSLEVWGRLCDLVTPSSASIRAVALAFIGSAWDLVSFAGRPSSGTAAPHWAAGRPSTSDIRNGGRPAPHRSPARGSNRTS